MKWRTTLTGFVFICFLVVSGVLAPGAAEPPSDSNTAQDLVRLRAANLSRISIALRDFDKAHGHFPQRVLPSDAGQPLLSWRVAVLPFLGHDKLYREFRLNEPWNSAHNRKLIRNMPDVFDVEGYVARDKDAAAGYTHVVAPVMEGSLWYGDEVQVRNVHDIQDGTAYTMAAFAAPPDAAVLWTKPEDLPISPENIGRDMFGPRESCLITTFDGASNRIARSAKNEDLKALITFDGKDSVIWSRFKPGIQTKKTQAAQNPN